MHLCLNASGCSPGNGDLAGEGPCRASLSRRSGCNCMWPTLHWPWLTCFVLSPQGTMLGLIPFLSNFDKAGFRTLERKSIVDLNFAGSENGRIYIRFYMLVIISSPQRRLAIRKLLLDSFAPWTHELCVCVCVCVCVCLCACTHLLVGATSFFFFTWWSIHSFIYLFIYLWLCWVFVSVRGLSLVTASGGHSSSWSADLSLSRPLLLRSTSSRCAGSVIVPHGPSCSVACGILPDQGLNPCPLHWQADSPLLRHQGSPGATSFYNNISQHFKIKGGH